MRQSAWRFVYGRTLNYNHSKPYIPPPPALPRFAFPFPSPSDRGDGDVSARAPGREEAVDPLDAAATAQLPALRASHATSRVRRVVRRAKPKLEADSTEEVQVEDILLEVYAEDPPPPPTRRSAGVPARPPSGPTLPSARSERAPVSRPPPALPVQASIAAAIASVVPPPLAQSAAVDALLRASDPAFAPFGSSPMRQAPVSAYAYPVEQDTSSIAPVAFPSMQAFPAMHSGFHDVRQVSPSLYASAPPPSYVGGPLLYRGQGVRPAKIRGSRGVAVAVWSVVLVVVGVATGAGIAVGARSGTFAQLRDSAKSAAARAGSKHAEPEAQPVSPLPAAPVVAPTTPVVLPPIAEAPAVAPSVPVTSLPQTTIPAAIPADSSMVTFPVAAQGHRVFFDGRLLAVTSEPIKLRCGRHMIRIGGSGKARVVDLACGREVTLAM